MNQSGSDSDLIKSIFDLFGTTKSIKCDQRRRIEGDIWKMKEAHK